MADRIESKIHGLDELQRNLKRIRQDGKDLTSPFKIIGRHMIGSINRNFKVEGRPVKWIQSRRAEEEGGQTLRDKGTLKNSIFSKVYKHKIQFGSNLKYAAVHQYGFSGTVSVPEHSRKTKYGSTRVRAHSRRMRLPARPFIVFQKFDRDYILYTISEALRKR